MPPATITCSPNVIAQDPERSTALQIQEPEVGQKSHAASPGPLSGGFYPPAGHQSHEKEKAFDEALNGTAVGP